MRSSKPTCHLSSVPDTSALLHSVCAFGCGWEVVTEERYVAARESATHHVQVHASQDERARIGAVVMGLEEGFAAIGEDLPMRLVAQAVHEVMFDAGVSGVAA